MSTVFMGTNIPEYLGITLEDLAKERKVKLHDIILESFKQITDRSHQEEFENLILRTASAEKELDRLRTVIQKYLDVCDINCHPNAWKAANKLRSMLDESLLEGSSQ